MKYFDLFNDKANLQIISKHCFYDTFEHNNELGQCKFM